MIPPSTAIVLTIGIWYRETELIYRPGIPIIPVPALCINAVLEPFTDICRTLFYTSWWWKILYVFMPCTFLQPGFYDIVDEFLPAKYMSLISQQLWICYTNICFIWSPCVRKTDHWRIRLILINFLVHVICISSSMIPPFSVNLNILMPYYVMRTLLITRSCCRGTTHRMDKLSPCFNRTSMWLQ